MRARGCDSLAATAKSSTMGIPDSFWNKPATTLSVSALVRIVWITTLCLVAVWTGSSLGGFARQAENGNTTKLFNWHPLLMVLAFPVLMTESVLIYRAPPLSLLPRPMRKMMHSLLLIISVICAFGAMVAVVASHRTADPKIADLILAHSWVGVTALSLFGLQILLGGVMLLMAGVPQSAKDVFTALHDFLGRATYFVGLTTIVSGLVEKTLLIHKGHEANDPAVLLPKVCVVLMPILGLLVGYLHAFRDKEQLPKANQSEEEALIKTNA